MKNKLFSNKTGFISFLFFVISLLFLTTFNDITFMSMFLLLIAMLTGLYFSLWVIIKLINYTKK